MRVNVCVNGTFRYPEYIRHYQDAGVLNRFYFAHRIARTDGALGLGHGVSRNLWSKHYASAALFRAAPSAWAPALIAAACDAWQRDVLRHWQDCDCVEAVIGAVADRVIARARRGGARVLGHPVTTHPRTMRRLVDRARADVGLPPDCERPADMARRLAEIADCDGLLVDSPFVARSFVEHGVAPDRISVVTPAFDAGRFQPRARGERDRACFTVVCVGTVTPRKAQQTLLRAWRRLALRDARLVLVGPRGRDAGAVLHGHAGFTHIPYLDHQALRRLLVRAACLVLVSAEDGFAQAPLEAMACGVPVILSDTVGAAHLVAPGHDGLVVPPFDVDALGAAFLRLYDDADLADRMGTQAAQTAHQIGSWRDYVDRVVSLHRALVAGVRASGRAAA